MVLAKDASNETVIYAVNRLTDAIEALNGKIDNAIDDRQLELKALRERMTRQEERAITREQVQQMVTDGVEERAVTRRSLLRWLGGIAAAGVSGWAFVAYQVLASSPH